MIIRDMRRSDIEAVRRVAARTWKDTYSAFIPEEIQEKVLKEAYSEEAMNERFENAIMLAAEINQVMAGYAFFSTDASGYEIFLESLYVDPDFQGKGVGKQLIAAGLSKFETASVLSLTVYKGNPNFSFYVKQGFEVIGEKEGHFFDHPMTFILMKKQINISR
ncbi:MAG: GNAT family N-acetyltransferase [Tuberibacillus sp.]